ncbi:hypothetical protein [Nostoc sp. MS1]|uniref:hypothetical protein n=1 Tax=Nostoc sp. MS1 TaxID=2764711 RepID=UPI001CC6A957|nr:hypothetical protein [Nostoc sp. MS1]BCL35368.1 hypothetical protein NSMS1_18150 [Nostoc sp. MS1]
MRSDKEITTFQLGKLTLQDQQFENTGIVLNLPNILNFKSSINIANEEVSSQKQIRQILSGMGLFSLHEDDWGILIDCFNSNLSDLKNVAEKIIDTYDGNISVFLEYQQFS